MTVQIINLTPHTVNVYHRVHVKRESQNWVPLMGIEPMVSVLSSGFARATEVVDVYGQLVVNENVYIPVSKKSFVSTVEGLPEPEAGTVYVVSFLTAQAVPDRDDVFFPGEAVRDPEGNLIGCLELCHV